MNFYLKSQKTCDFLLDFLFFAVPLQAISPVEQNEAEDKESPNDEDVVQESKV